MKQLVTAHHHDADTGEVEAEPVTIEQIGNAIRFVLHDGTTFDVEDRELREALEPKRRGRHLVAIRGPGDAA